MDMYNQKTSVRVAVGYLFEGAHDQELDVLLALGGVEVDLREDLDEHHTEEVAGRQCALYARVSGLSSKRPR
jgi:hypothetical protein